MRSTDFSSYVSPFSWRYGSKEMRRIFSERNKYALWRRIWIALAEAYHTAGLVKLDELNDLKKHADDIDIEKILALEKETKHDVVAAIREFASKARVGGRTIHLGATSADVVDNADAVRVTQALGLIQNHLVRLLKSFTKHIRTYAAVPCMGYTHLQFAEPTTVGYRLALYAQDLLIDLSLLGFVTSLYKAKGMKGAVGTRASYAELLKGISMTAQELDDVVAKKLDLSFSLITTQVAPRKFDYLVISLLASIASSLAKFAGDLRILQSAGIGEWSEPFGVDQVGSSAMPFKKNPIGSEKICSLARFVAVLPLVALENASMSYLERTLDDSANRRIIIAEACLSVDEMLGTAVTIVEGLVIHADRIAYNVAQYAPFAATETILIHLVKRGAHRQKAHELLRRISMKAWDDVKKGNANPMVQLLRKDSAILKYLAPSEIDNLVDVTHHIGDAPMRARALGKIIEQKIRRPD